MPQHHPRRRPLVPLLALSTALAAVAAGIAVAPADAAAPAAARHRATGVKGRVLSADEVARLRVPVTPREDRRVGRVYRGLSPRTSGLCAGLFQADGLTQCTHGPDATPAGITVDDVKPPLPAAPRLAGAAATAASAVAAAAAPSTAVVCDGDGTTGKRTQVLYVWASTDRLGQYRETFRSLAAGVDTIYDASAQETGGRRRVRFVTTPGASGTCVATVTGVQLTSAAMSDFSTMIRELQAKGYSRTDRKYLIFADARTYCGIGSFNGDTRKGDANRSNSGPSYARTDSSCWDPVSASHELGHNLGAVNNNAPNTSRGGHCVDEWDVMCYSDSPYYPAMVTKCADRAHDARLDCNHDDYYNTAPKAGSYLATYYNIADNPFLIMGAGGSTPTSPAPTTSTPATPTTTTKPATSGPTTTRPAGTCGLPETYTGTLTRSGRYALQPNGTSFKVTTARTLKACLRGPAGSDFNLHLYAWTGRSWVRKASGTSTSASESLTVPVSAGTYVWQVSDVRGSGSYTLELAR
ncbi:MAG: hypothetical protein U0Q15_01785 [Kineosporiaceae bacterium]